MRPKNRRGKRQQDKQEEEPEVDDLAVAAAFAQVTSFPTKHLSPSEEKEQPEEGAVVEGNDDNTRIENEEFDGEVAIAGNDDDSSDDESDVDLSEALAKMDDDEPIPQSSDGDLQRPKTEHELDPYKTPISDLEQKFQLNLTVAEQERLRLDKETNVPSKGGPVQLCAAGHIKCHMVEDRTIVVESVATGGTAPLDEGSLLVIQSETDDENAKSQLVPLGKIFELFGPVSRPLYTIRLPSAKDKRPPKRQKNHDEAPVVERDADEISLNDEDDAPVEDQTCETVIHKSTKDEQSGKVVEGRESDPWSPQGKYTLLLETSKYHPVYYISDIAKVIDTGAIIRNSGRGCDASNLYDEEVINANDMDFSDDEQEREYKNRNKRGKKGKKGGGGRSSLGHGTAAYTGFHAPQPAQQYAAHPTQYATPMMTHPIQYQVASGAYHYQQPYAYPQQPPHQYAHAAPGYARYAQVPVPPPPPYPYPYEQSQRTAPDNEGKSNNESSDTVYYD